MIEFLDRQLILTRRQRRIVAVAIVADMLEFLDYFLVGFVLAFIVVPWRLTYGQSAVILLSSGIGAIIGCFVCGAAADRFGRRKVFMADIIIFSLGTGIQAFTPEGAWPFLATFRLVVGIGVGGLYIVGLPLVQEFVPASKRGFIGGIVTSFIPIGTLLGSVLAAFLAPSIGWRGLFAIGMLPALLVLLVWAWVPESPRWLVSKGRREEARQSLAWAVGSDPETIPLPSQEPVAPATSWLDIFRYPRSLIVSALGTLGVQTGVAGLILWSPTLLVLILHIKPAQASFLMIFVSLGGLVGRFAFSWLSERLGRRISGGLLGFGAAVMLVLTALAHNVFLGTASLFWLLLIVTYFFADGGFAVAGPYAAEVWPSWIRTSGMGATYGFGGIGKIIGPLGLALIIGSSNVITPGASITAIVPAFVYLACWYALSGAVYLFAGMETRGLTFEAIEQKLQAKRHMEADASDHLGVSSDSGA